jgi:hypothetical protein
MLATNLKISQNWPFIPSHLYDIRDFKYLSLFFLIYMGYNSKKKGPYPTKDLHLNNNFGIVGSYDNENHICIQICTLYVTIFIETKYTHNN